MSAKGRKNSNYKYAERSESELSTRKKKITDKYSFTQKLLPTLLLAIAGPFTVFVFTPFDTYYGNMDEFAFSLGDFMPLCILFAVLVSAVVFSVLILLRNTAYEIGCGVTAWISLMLVLQRLFLNMGVNSLAGDGVGTSAAASWMVVLDIFVWVAVGAGIVLAVIFFGKTHVEMLATLAVIAMVTVLGMQLVSFTVVSLTSDVYTPTLERARNDNGEDGSEPKTLTFDNFTTFSSNRNVVIFVVDRFDAKYYDKMVKADPSFFDVLDGFTYYNDYTSLYCRTYPSIATMLTGIENDPWDARIEYFKKAYSDGGHLREMSESGYDVNVYTKSYYAYDNAAEMSEYVDNTSGIKGYSVDSNITLAWDMIRLSLFQHLPFGAKNLVGELSTPEFAAHITYDISEDAYTSDLKVLYEYVSDTEFTVKNSYGNFAFIHLSGCHTPISYGESWDEATDKEKNDTNLALKQNFLIINKYLDEMKRLGVYDDATVIITGDHPAAISDTKLIGQTGYSSDNGTRVTAMFVKKSGSVGSPLQTSSAQVSQDELWATVFESEGLISLKSSDSFFDIPEDEERVRRYIFEQSKSSTKNDLTEDRLVIYKISGTARDPENWEISQYVNIGKIYK